MADSRFLITGATGFVGRRLVPELVRKSGPAAVTGLVYTRGRDVEERALKQYQQAGVNTVGCDLLSLPSERLKVPEFDVVYHLAAFGGTERSDGPFELNSKGTENLLECLGESLRGKLVIYTGTLASVDRDRPEGPIGAETPCTPKTPYGRTKLEGEEILRRTAARYGFDYVILRLCTIIGKDFRPGGMFEIFPRLLARGALAGRLNWPGRSSFLSNSDLAKILTKVPEVPKMRNETYVLSNDEAPTFDEFLDLIAEVLHVPRKRIVLPAWFWPVSRSFAWRVASMPAPYGIKIASWRLSHLMSHGLYADASKLNKALGGFKYQTVREALTEAYAH